MIADLLTTLDRVNYLMRNGFHVPTFLVKRITGHLEAQSDYERGYYMVMDSLQDEVDYLEELENER